MPQILEAKGGQFTVMDAVFVAVSKSLSERLLAKTFVGNGTLFSGALKMAGAVALTGFSKNKWMSIVGTGLMVDGGEDLVHSFLGGSSGSDTATAKAVGTSNQGAGFGSLI